MEVMFEVGKTKGKKVKSGSSTPSGDVNVVKTEAELKKEANKIEKERLQGILAEAGVDFVKTLGVTKLQILVNELEKQPEE